MLIRFIVNFVGVVVCRRKVRQRDGRVGYREVLSTFIDLRGQVIDGFLNLEVKHLAIQRGVVAGRSPETDDFAIRQTVFARPLADATTSDVVVSTTLTLTFA